MAKSPAFVGRADERHLLEDMLRSHEAEFLALYGRRRVGKTFLVRSLLEPQVETFLGVTGEKDAALRQQLAHFQIELEKVFFGGQRLPAIPSWREGLRVLSEAVLSRSIEKPIQTSISRYP